MTLQADYFNLTIGAPADPILLSDIRRIIVDTSMHMPSMCEIHIADEYLPTGLAMKWADTPRFVLGMPVSLTAGIVTPDATPLSLAPVPLFSGEIVAIDMRYNGDGTATLIVRAYDKTHRLHRGRKTKTFLMMPDNLIIQTVTAAAGVIGVVSPTGGPNQYVLQNNQTDMEFIRQRAALNGMDVMVDALGVLQVKKIGLPSGLPAALIWGENLISFEPRLSGVKMSSTAQAMGWDPLLKIPAVGVMVPIPAVAQGTTDLDATLAMGVFGVAQDVVNDQPVDMDSAMVLATARASASVLNFTTASGTCLGNPMVRAGNQIGISGVGVKFAGNYYVTSARHIFDPDGGYTTQFDIDGSEPQTFHRLLSDEETRDGRIQGVVVGIVTNNMDPQQQGRVKVLFPWMSGGVPAESDWARVISAGAGIMRGIEFIPEIGDEVLVTFEHGDPNRPYVVGGVWGTTAPMPVGTAQAVIAGKVVKRIIRSSIGHTITLDDTPGAMNITIQDSSMTNKVVITTAPTPGISIETAGQVAIKAAQGIDLQTPADVQIQCASFKVKAASTAEITAAGGAKVTTPSKFEVMAGQQLNMQGGLAVNLKGGLSTIAMAGLSVNVNNGALEVT
jgi:phage protein D/phage baseplate assembly protein gpV